MTSFKLYCQSFLITCSLNLNLTGSKSNVLALKNKWLLKAQCLECFIYDWAPCSFKVKSEPQLAFLLFYNQFSPETAKIFSRSLQWKSCHVRMLGVHWINLPAKLVVFTCLCTKVKLLILACPDMPVLKSTHRDDESSIASPFFHSVPQNDHPSIHPLCSTEKLSVHPWHASAWPPIHL